MEGAFQIDPTPAQVMWSHLSPLTLPLKAYAAAGGSHPGRK